MFRDNVSSRLAARQKVNYMGTYLKIIVKKVHKPELQAPGIFPISESKPAIQAIRFSITLRSELKYTFPSMRTTGLRMSRGSFSIKSISWLSLNWSFSMPKALKLGLLKLNISEAGLP
jgi:hypothetical protein